MSAKSNKRRMVTRKKWPSSSSRQRAAGSNGRRPPRVIVEANARFGRRQLLSATELCRRGPIAPDAMTREPTRAKSARRRYSGVRGSCVATTASSTSMAGGRIGARGEPSISRCCHVLLRHVWRGSRASGRGSRGWANEQPGRLTTASADAASRPILVRQHATTAATAAAASEIVALMGAPQAPAEPVASLA
jgi:hypothetical protein